MMAVLPGVRMIMGDRQKQPPSEATPGPNDPLPDSMGDLSNNGVLLLAVTSPPLRIPVATCDYNGVVPWVWGALLLYSRS